MRRRRRRRNRLIALFGCVVVLVTALALMVPALGLTDDAADVAGVATSGQFDKLEAADWMAQETTSDEGMPIGEETRRQAPDDEDAFADTGKDVGSSPSDPDDEGDASKAGADVEEGEDAGLGLEGEGLDDADGFDDEGPSEDPDNANSPDEDEGEGEEPTDPEDSEDDPDSDEAADSETPAQSFEAHLEDENGNVVLTVAVKAPEGAFPVDARMQIDGVDADAIWDKVAQAVSDAKGESFEVKQLTGVDIVFQDADGGEIEPASAVEVKITSNDVRDFENPILVHVLDKSKESSAGKTRDAEIVDGVQIVNEDEADTSIGDEDTMKFESRAFSPYVIAEICEVAEDDAGSVIDDDPDAAHALTAQVNGYKVTVTYSSDAEIPEDASLEVQEIADESSEYREYASAAEDELGMEEGSALSIHLLDIKIVDADGNKVEIAAPVNVKIELAGDDAADAQVVHFADDADEPDVVDNVESKGDAVSFEAEGFSVYAIVTGPSTIPSEWQKLTSLADLASYSGPVYIGHTSGYYFKDSLITDDDGRTGIAKTSPAQSYPTNAAAKYYFELKEGTTNQFYVYCLVGGVKKYVFNGGDNSLSLITEEENKTAFTVSVDSNGKFKLNHGNWYWNMQKGASGTRFCSYNSANDNNNTMYIWSKDEEYAGDPYRLDGKEYALLTWGGGKTGKALTGDANGTYPNNLCADFLTVMTRTGDSSDKLYVPNNTSDTVASWTFTWTGEGDKYLLSTQVKENGVTATKYLKIDSSGLHMVDQASAGKIQVVPGTGIHEGQIILKQGNNALTYSGEFAQGFGVNAGTGKEYLYLAIPESELVLEDYYKTYTATKISVSDKSLTPESPDAKPKKVIVYTRAWNGSSYKYFAINGEGKLVPCYESGDSIEWVGPALDELEWEFTEYGSWSGDTFTPNYYYELQSTYGEEGSYLAPQITGSQVLSEKTIGLTLTGRRNEQYYTPILAWDKGNYCYAGIRVNLDAGENALIEPCFRAEGLDFYFAIVDEVELDDTIHEVPTVDNNPYGIKMRMVNYSGEIKGVGCTTTQEQTDVLQDNEYRQKNQRSGLLSTNLDENGYPVSTLTGRSLGDLYTRAQDVNHLFIESTYRASGYYEFDSSQNFATLNSGVAGNFKVYQELGSYDTGGNKPTLKHGQFFPYNDLHAGVFATTNGRNLYSPTGEALKESNPRYNEQLYLVEKVDCYFGAELEASFVQTPSGLDAWGHDIIFEFSGDDDFWLYVDGELVIDLGGIHSALPGSVNFRTGDVYVNNVHYTLRELFENNFRTRNPDASQAEVDAFLKRFFEEGSTVFRDGTTHTMNIFYMERGAGASNLHMRFNLASVKKGTVHLSKKLDNVDTTESAIAVYPYQIWFKNPLTNVYEQLTRENIASGSVKYKDSTKDVVYKDSLRVSHTLDGTTYLVDYDDVYLLAPGEIAEIEFPVFGQTGEEQYVQEYKIVECGVDPEVYDGVSLENPTEGTTITGKIAYAEHKLVNEDVQPISPTDSGLRNYEINYASLDDRARVTYINRVKETKSLEIQKELYKKEGATREKIELYNPDGTPIDPDDPDLDRVFEFRLSFKTVYDSDFTAANMSKYHVKDPAGYYCKRRVPDPDDPNDEGGFERITNENFPEGITDYDDLTDDVVVNGVLVERGEKSQASFDTSPGGSISMIPAYYTVEVRGLIPGTQFKVVERPGDTPDGYQFWQYALGGSAVEVDDVWDGVTGAITSSEAATAQVRNDKGYGLRLEKVWADASTIQGRTPTYFAVYCETKDALGLPTRTLVPDSVQQLAYAAKPQELYWWYLNLPIADTVFNNYVVYEVTGDFTVEDGKVTAYSNVEPVLNRGILTLQGTAVGQSEAKDIEYAVTYATPVSIGNNVRKFKATDTPSTVPAVKLLKEDWSGGSLKGARFVLNQGDSQIFDETSNTAGFIATAYLDENTDYVLTEMASPQGYHGLEEPLTIRLVATASGWTLNVSPSQGGVAAYYETGSETESDPDTGLETQVLTLTIKNRPYDLEVVKIDGSDNGTKVKGAKFQLYKLTTDGTTTHPVLVTWGDQDTLTTGADGLIPRLDNSLPAGQYLLRETAAASGYSTLSSDVYFTVTQMGSVGLDAHPNGVVLSSETKADGTVAYKITIPDEPVPLQLCKVDESREDLVGAKFNLKRLEDGAWVAVQAYNVIDMTTVAQFTLSSLPAGLYRLEEASAPNGYVILQQDVFFRIESDRTVTLTDESGNGANANDKASLTGDKVNGYTLTVANVPGVALPITGGPGTLPVTLAGSFMVLAALLILARAAIRRRITR